MNLPNKLTILRVCMIPVYVAAFYITEIPFNFIVAAVIFALAAFTDFLDGYIARKNNIVTDFGKFLDPIADKVLVSTALIIFLAPPTGIEILPNYAAIFVAAIIARELIISGFRLVAAGKNIVIAADKSGKIKTFFTDITIIFILICAQVDVYAMHVAGIVLLGVSALLTVISGAECIIKNISALKQDKK